VGSNLAKFQPHLYFTPLVDPNDSDDAILAWQQSEVHNMNNNGLLWVIEEDDFSSIDFLATCKASYASHPVEKSSWEVFFFIKECILQKK
jgi:hypothetical protein